VPITMGMSVAVPLVMAVGLYVIFAVSYVVSHGY
jgi:hypothetical protein